MAGVVAGAEAGFHRMILEDHQKQRGSKESCEETNDHHLRRAPARLPSASSLARRLLLLPTMELFGVLVMERKSLDWQRLGK
jgi:hypothetical protein